MVVNTEDLGSGRKKSQNEIIAEIKMRKLKKFLCVTETKRQLWKLREKEKDVDILGDKNKTRQWRLLSNK